MSPQPRGRLLTHGHGDEELDGEVDEEVQPGVETILMLMMNTPEGGGAPRRWIPVAFPPSDLLRR